MKIWRMGGVETMWACGSCNLPENKDVIVDTNRREWIVSVNGGYTLRDRGGNAHPVIRDRETWQTLVAWFNEHAEPGAS